MSDSLTVTKRIHFSMANRGKREIKPGPQPVRDTPDGRIPRVSRLMALAIKFDNLLASGAVRDQAELAELGHVSRARVTQIMNLLHLAPDIQEEILFLPRVTEGRDPLAERHLRPIAAQPDWAKQREMWQAYTIPMQNEFVERFVERIEIRRKDSEIDVTFKQDIREHFRQ